jgi:hypothetical protein
MQGREKANESQVIWSEGKENGVETEGDKRLRYS